MSRLAPATYLNHLRAESARFREVLATAPTDARVPACPDWNADDLLWHLAEVQWFWGTIITNRPAGPAEATPDRPEGRAELLGWFDQVSSTLADALAGADPTQEAWSWADDHTVGFTYRRQAHEALIHRLDAEQVAGQVTPLPADLAADGVAELMEVMHGGEPPAWGGFTPSGRHTAIELTDTGDRIRVASGWFSGTHPEAGLIEGHHVVRVDDDGPADVVVRGPATDLDAWLWRRRPDEGITVEGDEAAYAEWRSAVDQPLD